MQPDEWLRKSDIRLWLHRTKVREAHQQCMSDTGCQVSRKEFKQLREENCQYWRQMRRRGPSRARALNHERWEQVKSGVEHLSNLIREQSMTRQEAVTFLCANRVCVNELILQGLPSRLHVWREATQ